MFFIRFGFDIYVACYQSVCDYLRNCTGSEPLYVVDCENSDYLKIDFPCCSNYYKDRESLFSINSFCLNCKLHLVKNCLKMKYISKELPVLLAKKMIFKNDYSVIFTSYCYYDVHILWINLNSDKIIHKQEIENQFENVSEIYDFLKAYHETVWERNPNDILVRKYNVLYHVCQKCFRFLCTINASFDAKQTGCLYHCLLELDEDIDLNKSGICFRSFASTLK